jgi:flavin reductase (DIM6/NTAB) family NADH-FMN oxidoreductase RutF
MSIRSQVARFVRPFPQWSAIGFSDREDWFSIQLAFSGRVLDVTHNNNCASLVPLTLAIGLPSGISPDQLRSATLSIHDNRLHRRLGTLRLRNVPSLATSIAGLALFEVEAGRHTCLSFPRRVLERWVRGRDQAKNTDAHNFVMSPRAVEQVMIFYIYPRQVVLVSVSDESGSNIFPMDILGPIADGYFTLGLRNTSPSVATITRTRRVALSSIRSTDRTIAYRLGAHHKSASVNLADLPFAVGRSETFGLPVPAAPLRIRELDIDDVNVIGSHTFFAGRVVSDIEFSDEPQLHHTAGFHSYFQARQGRPFC